ncbi:MAG: glutaredoxin family protein [Planctomycetota bacterium]
MGPPTLAATLYSRRDCPLCDRLAWDLEDLALRPAPRVVVVDVDASPELRERFGDWVPVLEVAGQLLVRGVWSRDELARRWTSLAAGLEEDPC